MAGMMVGGTGEEQKATDEIQNFCELVKDAILKKSGKDSFEMYKALKYKSQCVAGTNYFVQIQVHPGGECVHARIYQPLPHTNEPAQLSSLQTDKNVGDAVEYF